MTGRPPLAVVASTIPATVSTFHRELLRQLGAAGYELLVVSSPGPDLDDLGRQPGVRVEALPMPREVAPRADALALRRWIRLLRRERPALIVTATPKASLVGLLAARLTRVPRRVYYLGGLRLEGETGTRRRVLGAAERLTAACAQVVIVNSPSLAAAVRRYRLTAPAKLRVIRPASSHGVDAGHFVPRAPDPALRSALGLADGGPVVGFVGRVTADKGVETLVAALRLLRTRGRAVQLLVLGSPDERDSRGWVSRLQEEADVVLTGHVADVRPYLALVDVHVLPSRREGFPNVVLEAGAMGIASVTTRATGAVDAVRDGETGLLVDVDAPDQLADAVERLLDDPGLRSRLGAAAREWVVLDFQPERIVASFVGHILGTTRA
ncbi:MAG TPA: glycosyltransferase family 4 protein [Lapillicoccus sp.]|nr:glycosyltransferase family 4 protein [Lapillicoccus sp.]